MITLRRQYASYWHYLIVLGLVSGLVWGQSAWAGPQMRSSQRSYPRQGHIVHKLPRDHQVLQFRAGQYYFHDGVYYHRDSKGFRVVNPPKGLVVRRLPPKFETQIVAGMTYFVLAGIFYRKTDTGYVVVDAPAATVRSLSGPTVLIVTANLLNVRSGPGSTHPVIGQIGQGTRLEIQGNAPGWVYVRLPNETYGWVMSVYTRPSVPNAKG